MILPIYTKYLINFIFESQLKYYIDIYRTLDKNGFRRAVR